MQPKDSLPPAQFHDWYNNDHGPTRLRLSWCHNGFRYRANDANYSASKPEYMAVYDIEDMDHLTKDEYTRLRKEPVQSQRERDTMKQITVDRRFYDFVSDWTGNDFKKLENIENQGEGNVMVAVSLSLYPGEDKEEELRKWYEEEHVPLLQKVPGWRRTRRFVTSYIDLKEGKSKEFLALHEYAPQNGLGGKEFQAATSTPWNAEMYKSVIKEKQRRTYDLFYTFGPASRDLTSLSDPKTVGILTSTDGLTKTTPAHASKTDYPAIESYITTPDGVRIPYILEGSASPTAPVLICMNSILVDYHIWDSFIPYFHSITNSRYRTLRFNTRGRSSLPATSTRPITIATLSQDVIALLDALRIKTASMIGVSLGGAVTLNAALTYPDRITALVSCDTNALAPPGNPKAWGERLEVADKEGLKTQSGETIVGSELAEMTVRRWFVKESYEDAEIRPRIEAVKEAVTTNSLEGFRASVNALYQYDFREKMKGYEGRGVFLVGAGDGVLPKSMREMAEGLGRGVELKVVDGAGHLPMVERPEEVAEFVKGFL
ncbi:3-oxoadipate enol-lactonase 2, partial [Lophiostoma macrostomum CBS 122681]